MSTRGDLSVAVAQYAPTEDKTANLAEMEKAIQTAVADGARLVVLPEYATYTRPVMDASFVDQAEPLDGQTLRAVRTFASRYQVYIVLGVNESTAHAGKIHNTIVAIAPDQAIMATYRKTHLYDAFGYRESAFVLAGSVGLPAEILVIDGWTLGLQTCYDLRFPEVSRLLVDAGADAIICPAEWVPGPLKEDHWRTLVRARAIENTVYLLAANQTAPAGCGNSMIVDPMGGVLAGLAEQDGVCAADLMSGRLDSVRKENPSLTARRLKVVPL